MAGETGQVTSAASLDGSKLYQKRARSALPILVRQARAEQTIYYGDLAEELGMPNPRNLNYVLGTIGNALLRLAAEWKTEVPPIQALVINQDTDLPGEGIAWFAPDAKEFKSATVRQRKRIVASMLAKVFGYERWPEVLDHLGLQPAKPASAAASPAGSIGGGGETSEHRNLKEFLAKHPERLGLPKSLAPGEIEFTFGSGDAIDVVFKTPREWVGVEVKSKKSPVQDLARGLYQCVKYQALLEATMMIEQVPVHCRTILAVESRFPENLIPVRNTLGVEVWDSVTR